MTSRITILELFRLTSGSAATAAVPSYRESDVQAFSFNALQPLLDLAVTVF
jgi:hypothetical protein